MSFFHAGPAPKASGPRSGALRDGLDLSPGMTVGLFGGSFNPAHDGHLHGAETALNRLGLDRVVWLVSPQNPLKSADETADLATRMAGARAKARGPKMIVSDAETRLGVQYTLDIIRILKARFPGVHFVWIMGADSLANLHRWHHWTDIMESVPVAVLARPGYSIRALQSPAATRYASCRVPQHLAASLPLRRPPAFCFVTMPLRKESSTAIRNRRKRS